MGKPNEKPTVEQMLKLVEELSPKDREQFLNEVNLRELRRSIQIGIDQADSGDLVDGDDVFRQMRQRNASMREDSSL